MELIFKCKFCGQPIKSIVEDGENLYYCDCDAWKAYEKCHEHMVQTTDKIAILVLERATFQKSLEIIISQSQYMKALLKLYEIEKAGDYRIKIVNFFKIAQVAKAKKERKALLNELAHYYAYPEFTIDKKMRDIAKAATQFEEKDETN